MKIVNLSQRTPAWLAWRAQGVTASEAAVILGRSPYQTPWRLWAEKTGLCLPDDLSNNPFVQRGIALEDTARQGFEERHDTLLLPVCAEHTDHPALRCSFDGLTESDEPVELKVPAQKTWDAVAREGEDSLAFGLYWVQVQFQLAVAEAARGWLVFDPVRPKVRALEFVIERDAGFIEQELIPACLQFHEAVRKKQEPTPDPQRDCFVPMGEEALQWDRLAAQYRAAERRAKVLEAELKGHKAQLAEAQSGLVGLMGEFLLADQTDLRVLRYRQQGSVDYATALEALMPDLDPTLLESHRRPASERVRVTLKGDDAQPAPAEPDTPRRRRRKASAQASAPAADDSAASVTETTLEPEPIGYF
ncbi:phage-type endonuclease [Thiorhodococcus drewsii AZ1]|uniref:Phage-type endonuclease n=1 Tax=Thiorhodococcus drewsii AZ1 TaxID=765913 RepID=G2E4K7_9GAMM|nr:YqaJ viral recombinase family protein [Thiorhodococcus drewsii]EGV29628.1 phage-type endonuclease [Thiorhodococcus drewsii AZ1]